VPLWCNG